MTIRARIIVAALFIGLSSAALAQEAKTVPQSKADIAFSFSPIVKKAAPAVVNIYTKHRVTVMENASPFMNDPFFRQFFGNNMAFGGRPREQVVSSLGSGVIINPKGFVVTSHHVISDAQEITVVLSNKEEYPATVVMKDPQSDLAFLKITPKEDLPFLEMRDSDMLEVGDLVLAIGNPFGVGQTVTSGIVSALARKAEGVSDYQFFIQTDAAINPGNSGGALVTADGKLVGINTAIYSKSGGSLGIGFAIPSNMVRTLLASKVEGGRVIHPWMGAATQPVTREIADSLGLKSAQGVIVRKIYPGSPAEKSGLRVGDVIISAGGAQVDSQQDLQYRLALAKIGDSGAFQIIRGGARQTLSIGLIAPPENPKRDIRSLKGRHPLAGVTVANLSPAFAAEAGIDDMATGVIAIGVTDSGNGVNLGWSPGDIIVEINGEKIDSTEQLEKLLKASTHSWKIVFARRGQINSITVQM